MNSNKQVFVLLLLVLLLIQSTHSADISRTFIEINKPQIIETQLPVASEKLHSELVSLAETFPLTTTKVLIEVENKKGLKEISLITKSLGGKNIKEFETGKIVIAEIPANKLNELALNSKVKFVFPDREIKAALNEGVPQINADIAWDYGFTGKNIKIAVLDTGIASQHEMLQGKVILEKDFSGTGNPTDVFGHGTHVAGIAAGTTEFGGTYNGVAPYALLLNGKVLNDFGVGTSSSVIAGINWAVNPDGNTETDDGADIINLSLGAAFSDVNSPINLAIRDAIVQAGVIVIAAAGNCGESCPSMACGSFRGVGVPGDSPDAITVGAVDKQNNWACFSAGGNIQEIGIKPDLSAPGVNINSSVPDSYGTKSGTSMSAPFVSGAVALMLEANPLMTPQEIKQWLELHSLDLGLAGKDEKFGSGLIDLTNINKITIPENNAPIFNSINIARNVLIGNENEIIVNVTDNEEIIEVNALIVNPLSEEITLNLTESNNDFWSTTFLDTNTTGNYLVELRAVDNQGLQTIASISFNVVESLNDLNQSDLNFTGSQTELSVPEEIIKEEEGLVSLNLFLVGSSEFAMEEPPQDTTVEFYVKDSAGNLIEKEFVGPIEVPVNQHIDFNYFWTSSVVNDYNIGAIVFTEGTQAEIDEKSTVVTVPENSAEITSFNINPLRVEKGTTQNYLIKAKNDSLLSLNSFIEIVFTDSNKNVVGILSSDKIQIDCNSTYLFDLNQTILLKPGNYDLNAILHFEDKINSVNPVNVSVFVPEIGSIDLIEIPSGIAVDENLNIKINFKNNGAIKINPVFFAEIVDGNETIGILNFGGEDVNAGLVKVFDENWTAKVNPGNYNLNITAFYGNKEHEINLTENFSVIDVQAPLIENLSFNESLMQDSLVLIEAEFSDSSELNVIVSIQGTDYSMNKISSFGRDSNWNYTFFETENIGEYSLQITACDEFSNCFTSPFNSFTVNQLPTACLGNKVLLVEREQTLSSFINSEYCVTKWSLELNGVPSIEYLNKFDAVVWSEGNNITPIGENESLVLIEFVSNKGKLLLEGQDIAFNHVDDNFMQFVAHSTLFSDLILNENSNETINISIRHPITFPLNEMDFNYELSPFPDTVIPAENAFSLAEWSSGNSAAVLFNNYPKKGIFFPFNLNALNEREKTILLNDSIKWLLESSSIDLSVNEIIIPEFIIENIYTEITVLLNNNNESQTIYIYVDNQETIVHTSQNSFTKTVNLSRGTHTINAFINPSFVTEEKYYLNNFMEKEFVVAPAEADLITESITALTATETAITTKIKNTGGSTANNVPVQIFYNNTLIHEENINLEPNTTKTVSTTTEKEQGINLIEVKVNPEQTVIEADYTNNNQTKEHYVCSKTKILLVSDNDTENNSTNNPDSSSTFESVLKSNGYCYEIWDEKTQGTPSIEHLNKFELIIWSAGNHWNTTINENNKLLLEQFNKPILFEGADIAFDHSEDSFLQENLHITLDKDLTIKQETLILSNHEILNNIPQLTIDGNYCPYPDSVNVTDSINIAEWPNAQSAITLFNSSTKPVIYFGFSIDSVIEVNSREQLVVNSIELLRESIPTQACGNVNGDDSVNIGDLVYLINYIFGEGPAPQCDPITSCADTNGDGKVNIGDPVYLINYIFTSGPAPVCQTQ